MAKTEQDFLGRTWDFARVHLAFWRPIALPELTPGTKRYTELQEELDDAAAAVRTLPDDALDEFITEDRAALTTCQTSVSETRSRAAQLLAVTGFITLLASLGTSPPGTAAGTALMVSVGLLAVYALVGTMWLTVSAIAVRSWDELVPRAIADDTARAMRERYAADVHRVRRKTRIRLERPVGYLRDAYWFFFATVALLVVIVILRFLPIVQAATTTPAVPAK